MGVRAYWRASSHCLGQQFEGQKKYTLSLDGRQQIILHTTINSEIALATGWMFEGRFDEREAQRRGNVIPLFG